MFRFELPWKYKQLYNTMDSDELKRTARLSRGRLEMPFLGICPVDRYFAAVSFFGFEEIFPTLSLDLDQCSLLLCFLVDHTNLLLLIFLACLYNQVIYLDHSKLSLKSCLLRVFP
ncbi:unnamed protein product [Musa acuminata subsp. malaccensis]|uniref:(wild Malaysian banana) hypothetical protein n=1 Tax=Musa acuminata subsp. malaccensis TaxID=214687 RepID=A0A804JX43_MUSAM|nr:unnamed protein product [Musa acuminata subsp. malaccensis]